MPERHFILPEGACGEGIPKGNYVPLGLQGGSGNLEEGFPGFLLLFVRKK